MASTAIPNRDGLRLLESNLTGLENISAVEAISKTELEASAVVSGANKRRCRAMRLAWLRKRGNGAAAYTPVALLAYNCSRAHPARRRALHAPRMLATNVEY